MANLTFAELAELCGGELVAGADVAVSRVVIDSREADENSVFFAIRGERLDGHEFLAQALEKAKGAVVVNVPAELPKRKALVRVTDTTTALQNLARGLRRRSGWYVIGITGSAGKTTTKEMIATLVATER
ncbi:MAG: UDP-N-acetylmuramoylalanyl-D-glutamate--2,6-diaminopimelate ligase, partial [Acidobacteria bacterium]|nr:UDP-N-acetylmuramoylalanyl-D-glutamate--2,6-diaminopimelate ligase [Acidobacteriota bacterium]